jgi:hypothetical protein
LCGVTDPVDAYLRRPVSAHRITPQASAALGWKARTGASQGVVKHDSVSIYDDFRQVNPSIFHNYKTG